MEFYPRSEERTGMQEGSPYEPMMDAQCDFIMVYGIHGIRKRTAVWKKHGYVVHLMTGVAWGEYQDYLYGKFDGIDHHDEGQVMRGDRAINHGIDIPYMVPSVSFSRYLTEKLKKAVDCGVEAIHLEEPEFWAGAGYSEAFKREWEIFYREPWQDQAASADAAYRSGRLKQYLYRRMLDRLCSELKEYAMVKYHRRLRFYVPTHSLINYSQWGIVSPESSLLDLPGVDGYIAQIWTGTARTPNRYEGVRRERTFETAFLEYGVMQELVRGTDRKMWFLHDPVEDVPDHTWADYRYNYYRTVVASLMHPGIHTYEVAPWPSRIFMGAYPSEDDPGKREGMPEGYRTNLLTVMNALRDMNQPGSHWEEGMQEVGLLLADSAMYQRVYPDGDPRRRDRGDTWDPFYGLALPLLKHGLAVRPVQLDNIRRTAGYLAPYRVLVLSYEYMKPDSPDIHNALAQWVQDGGVLVYVGDGKDTFHKIRSWWNQNGAAYADPAEHLFEACGLERRPSSGVHMVKNGFVCVMDEYPGELAKSAERAAAYRALVRDGMTAAGLSWRNGTRMVMRRGVYTVTAVLDENQFAADSVLHGMYIDMFNENLPVVTDPVLTVGSVGLYYDLFAIDRTKPAEILCAAARIEKFSATARTVKFRAVSAEGSKCVLRMAVKRPPVSVSATCGKEPREISFAYDEASETVLLRFANSTCGVDVAVRFIQ